MRENSPETNSGNYSEEQELEKPKNGFEGQKEWLKRIIKEVEG
jgi:hypothetical protein